MTPSEHVVNSGLASTFSLKYFFFTPPILTKIVFEYLKAQNTEAHYDFGLSRGSDLPQEMSD